MSCCLHRPCPYSQDMFSFIIAFRVGFCFNWPILILHIKSVSYLISVQSQICTKISLLFIPAGFLAINYGGREVQNTISQKTQRQTGRGRYSLRIDYSPLIGRDICQSRRTAESCDSSAPVMWHRLVDPGSIPPSAKLFSPFSNLVSHRKGIYFQQKIRFSSYNFFLIIWYSKHENIG